jgi:integrase
MNFHMLRHTHASLLIDQNVHAKAISTRLGHSSIGITMDTYGHLMRGAGAEAVKQLDVALGT